MWSELKKIGEAAYRAHGDMPVFVEVLQGVIFPRYISDRVEQLTLYNDGKGAPCLFLSRSMPRSVGIICGGDSVGEFELSRRGLVEGE